MARVVLYCYNIPFFSVPASADFQNNTFALQERIVVGEAIAELIQTEAIIEVLTPPWVANPLTGVSSKMTRCDPLWTTCTLIYTFPTPRLDMNTSLHLSSGLKQKVFSQTLTLSLAIIMWTSSKLIKHLWILLGNLKTNSISLCFKSFLSGYLQEHMYL